MISKQIFNKLMHEWSRDAINEFDVLELTTELIKRYEDSKTIIDKLPKTVDGVIIELGMRLYWKSSEIESSRDGHEVYSITMHQSSFYERFPEWRYVDPSQQPGWRWEVCWFDKEDGEYAMPSDFGLFSSSEACEKGWQAYSAEKKRQRDLVEKKQESLRSMAKKHGIDLNYVKSQDDIIDIEKGKGFEDDMEVQSQKNEKCKE